MIVNHYDVCYKVFEASPSFPGHRNMPEKAHLTFSGIFQLKIAMSVTGRTPQRMTFVPFSLSKLAQNCSRVMELPLLSV